MAALAPILTVASTAFSVVGALQEGKAANAAAKAEARMLEQQADAERDAAQAEARDFRRKSSRERAAGLSRLGAGGTAVSGSSLLVDEAFVRDAALGSSRILRQGTVVGQRKEQQAELSRFQGKSAKRASFFNAGSSLLSGAASFAGKRFG